MSRSGDAVLLLVTAALAMGCRIGFEDSARVGGDAAVDAADGDTTPPLVDAPLVTRTVSFGERATATYQNVSADTHLYEAIPGQTNGGGTDLSVYGPDGTRLFALFRFDMSALPAGSIVVHARLELVVLQTGDVFAGPVEVFALAESWDETLASWQLREQNGAWATPGGTRGALAKAFTFDGVPGPISVPLEPTVVQAWLDSDAQNHGLAVTTPVGPMHAHIHSRESVDVELRPLLVLDVSP